MKEKITIRTPNDIAVLLERWTKKREENFLAITLDGHHDVIRVHHISKGIANKTIVHPRECFYPAIKDNAVAVVFTHKHPSGYVQPSEEDNNIAVMLEMAGEILGIHVLDNLIIAKHGLLYSYYKNGRMPIEYTEKDKKDYAKLMAAELKQGGR
jgi:DNA repair protein RadC